jgi:hypothetical protein
MMPTATTSKVIGSNFIGSFSSPLRDDQDFCAPCPALTWRGRHGLRSLSVRLDGADSVPIWPEVQGASSTRSATCSRRTPARPQSRRRWESRGKSSTGCAQLIAGMLHQCRRMLSCAMGRLARYRDGFGSVNHCAQVGLPLRRVV